MHQQKIFQEKEYFRVGQYSFRNLTPRHQAKAHQVLARQFHRQEPLVAAYMKKYPNGLNIIELWNQFFSFLLDNAATNNLSAVVLDTQSNDKVIAAFICSDISFTPQSFINTLLEGLGGQEHPNTFIAQLGGELTKQLKPELQEFLSLKGRTVDFLAVAIDQAYLGRRVILKNMLVLVERLAKEGGYSHSYIFAANGKTNIVARNANYQLIAKVDAKEVVLRNRKPFSEVEELHRYPSLWLKEL